MADYFEHGGRAVQVYDSVRFLEITCRICRAISDGTLRYDVGCRLFQVVFIQAGRFLLDAGMNVSAEGNPAFVAKRPDGKAISEEWTTRMCHGKEARGFGEGRPRDEGRGTTLPGSLWVLVGVVWGRMWHAWHGGHDVPKV